MGDEVISQAEIEALINGATPANAQAGGEQQSDVSAAKPEPEKTDATPASEPVITVCPTPDPAVRAAAFTPVASVSGPEPRNGVELIMDVRLNVAVELGRSTLSVREILALGPGRVVELDKHAGEPVEVVINNKTVARGEVVVIDENFGVRITEIVGTNERHINAKAA
jgi:flagellar motor switch protein FliN/FliY